MTDLDFDGLHKIPDQPAARLMAQAGMKLGLKLQAPASAPVSVVLRELAERRALPEMLHLLSVVLPAREAVWWACLAARDLLPEGATTPSLPAAEAWVFKPDAANRAAAQRAMEGVDSDDDTVLCAVAAVYGDGTMGPGDLAQTSAPPGAVSASVLAMNCEAFNAQGDAWEAHALWLVARALDIARGGNGRVAAPDWQPATPEPEEDDAPAFPDDSAQGEA